MKIKVNNFNLKDTLLSGQCFRVFEEDSNFIVILNDRVINIKEIDDELIINSNNEEDLESTIVNYFDLNRDYDEINKVLSVDDVMKNCISKCNAYRIMNQNPFEMCISYIISQNNNVKRISNSINKLCVDKGKKVLFEGKEYYLFPTYEDIKNITTNELRNYGIGFRDKYIRDFLDKYKSLKDINSLTTNESINELMKVKGIGLKVASCILLFGYKRLDVFPIDTWVKQFISNNYNVNNDQKYIEKFTKKKFGCYSGLAIQYMFHSERNK